jgi:O-antigen/teichoic acid export membrane protein
LNSEGNNTKKKTLAVAGDLIYSIAGLVCMNGVLQLFMYPYLTKKMGEGPFGNVLTLLAVVSILATTFGSGANYSRMVSKTKGHDNNGDYNIYLAITSVISVIISVLSVYFIVGPQNLVYMTGFAILTVVSILRYYGDVEYRLNVNFKGFFIFYLLISIGYTLGTAIYPFTKSWILAVVAGELACFVYVIIKGSIFSGKGLFKPSEFFKENIRSMVLLSLTNMINALVLQSDKILLNIKLGGESVTVFYAATLVGKIIALLTTPLNGVIIGYLSKYKGKFTKKFFTIVIAAALGVGAVFVVGCFVASHIFVGIMYPGEVYNAAKEYFFLANAGQILYFISGSLMVVVLRFTDEKYQLIINMTYAVLFALIVIPSVWLYGLWGITFGLLAVNAIRFILVAAVGFLSIRKREAII